MNELIPDLSFADYLKLPAWSSSQMKLALDCPRKLKHSMENPEDPKKMCFIEGRALHGLTLENRQTYIIHPEEMPDAKGKMCDWSLKLNSAKEWVKQQNNGADVVSQAKHEEVLSWAEAIKADKTAMELLDVEGQSEVTGIANDPITGLPLRMRMDWSPSGGNAIGDIKTTTDASPDAFEKTVRDLHYDLQGYTYIKVYNLVAELKGWPPKKNFVFIAVEKTAPHIVIVYHLDGLYMETGRRKHELAMSRIKTAVDSGNWPTYGNGGVNTLTPPDWYCRKWGL